MKRVILCCILALGACNQQRPPGPTQEQADQLNDADAILNDMAANQEGPEAQASDPSNASD